MTYLLYGIEDYLIKKELNKLKKNIDDNDISYFDLEEVSLKEIVDDANSLSLFSNKRMIIVENANIFTGSGKKRDDIKYLEEYLLNPNVNTILVFTINADKLDSRKKIVSLIKEKGKVLEYNTCNVNNLVKEMFGNYKISDSDIRLLINRVGNNLNVLNNEIEKIKTYKDEDLNITSDDINNLTVKTVDVDIFHLIDNIILNNKKEALESYFEMIKLGEEPIKIIVMLANQFRLMYQVKVLNKQHYNIYDMMKILGQKKYPIEKAYSKSRNYSDEQILKKLYELANLDINIKHGKVNKNIALELFILENENLTNKELML